MMKTVFKLISKEKCTLKAVFPEKNEAFFSSLLSLSRPDLNTCECSLALSKASTRTQFLRIYRISAARRGELLGKTTVGVQGQKYAVHKINLNICTSTLSSFLFQRLFEPLVCNLWRQICLSKKLSSRYQGFGKSAFTTLHVLHNVFCSSYE